MKVSPIVAALVLSLLSMVASAVASFRNATGANAACDTIDCDSQNASLNHSNKTIIAEDVMNDSHGSEHQGALPTVILDSLFGADWHWQVPWHALWEK